MAESIPISEPYYVILFHTSMVQRPYVPTVSILETAFQYRQGKVTLPLGLDKNFAPTLPCLWYCLQLPRTRFDLVRVPMQGRKEAERFHFPHRIVLFPVPWHASFLPQLNNPWPKLIITPDDLLEAAQDLAQRLDHVLDVTPASALNVHTLQYHWKSLYIALALDRPQHVHPARFLDPLASQAALFSTHFVARLMRPDAEDAFPGQMMSQQDLLGHALHHQAQISTIAQLEALRTPPREAERIFPALLEAEAEKFQCPVSVGVPGIAPSHPSRQIVKTLRRIGIIAAPDDAESESAALEWVVAHRALSRGGIGFVSRPIDDKAFVWLDTIESLWAKGQQTPRTVWRCLDRLSRVVRRSFMDVELAVLSHASALTSFSEFPIGLMTLPYDTAPLCCRIPIAYRPLVPLTRTVQFELSPVPTTYLQGQLKVLVAECIPTDDIVGRISRRGWATAGRRVSEVANLTLHVQEINSAAELRLALREDTYDLLVISAHGFVDRNQHRTGFLCGHERVVEEELGPLPPIVCFSACQVSPRGRGTTNITDLMFRQGAIVILGTLVPIDVRRNTILMTRFFANIAEALQGKMPKNSFEAVWRFTMSSNAFNDILSSNTSLAHWASERQEGQSVIEEFMLHRARDRLRPGHIYQDTEAVLRDIAKDRGILNRFDAWMQSQGYIPESLFYAVLGWPERIVFYDAQYEKVFNQQTTPRGSYRTM